MGVEEGQLQAVRRLVERIVSDVDALYELRVADDGWSVIPQLRQCKAFVVTLYKPYKYAGRVIAFDNGRSVNELKCEELSFSMVNDRMRVWDVFNRAAVQLLDTAEGTAMAMRIMSLGINAIQVFITRDDGWQICRYIHLDRYLPGAKTALNLD